MSDLHTPPNSFVTLAEISSFQGLSLLWTSPFLDLQSDRIHVLTVILPRKTGTSPGSTAGSHDPSNKEGKG